MMKWVDLKSRESLKEGDLLQNKVSGNAYTVTYVGKQTVIVQRSIELCNPMEWKVLSDED